MSNSNTTPDLIIPNRPKLVIPGQQEPQPKSPEQQQIGFQELVNTMVTIFEKMCDATGIDHLEFTGKCPEGNDMFLHFSRKDTSKTCKKWLSKGLKRVPKTSHEGDANGKK